MILAVLILAAAVAADPPWGRWGPQPDQGAWDHILLAPNGEQRLRGFVRRQPTSRLLGMKLVKAGFVPQRRYDGCMMWYRAAYREAFTGGVSATVRSCQGTPFEILFGQIPPF